jgi:hypothetical protein
MNDAKIGQLRLGINQRLADGEQWIFEALDDVAAHLEIDSKTMLRVLQEEIDFFDVVSEYRTWIEETWEEE